MTTRKYQCRCGRQIFFGNSLCLGCNAPLGYEPALGELRALEPGDSEGLWKLAGASEDSAAQYRRCANLSSASGCNWIVAAAEPDGNQQTFCTSCRLDRTIPDLSITANQEAYRKISIAKRRLVSFLISLHLPVASKISEDPENGLAFDFLQPGSEGVTVMTGHSNGIITVNMEETVDATRERIRTAMHEPYRTLLGHLRHETGHYYWDRLVAGTQWLEGFRSLFGDEQQDYAAALQAHYDQGPPAGWQERFVSAYASAHPWEDWAETWAHYLHMLDTFDTALSFGLDPEVTVELEVEAFGEEALFPTPDPDGPSFLHFLNSWVRLTAVLNELSRAMGLPDFYPFVTSRGAAAKLYFVHLVIREVRKLSEERAEQTVPPPIPASTPMPVRAQLNLNPPSLAN